LEPGVPEEVVAGALDELELVASGAVDVLVEVFSAGAEEVS